MSALHAHPGPGKKKSEPMSDLAEINLKAKTTKPATAEGLAGWLAEARALGKLAAPLMFTQLAQMAIMTTDIVMLGRLSATALAAATLGNTVFFFAWLFGFGPASAVSPMIAHAVGANPNDRTQARHIARMGLWSVLILSVPLMAILLFTRPILIAFDQDPKLAAMAGQFTAALCLGLPASIGYQVLRNFATALNRAMVPLIVMLAAIAFNALGDYALIFGHFGFPKLGLVGSGISSTLSFSFTFVAMAAVIYWTPALRKYRIFRRFWRPVWHQLAEVFRLGLPIGMTTIFEAMMFNAATLTMGTFGAASLAAHQIATNVPSITFMVPLGIGMAATVRVGLAAGAGDGRGVRRAGYSAMAMGVGFMAITSTILLLFPDRIAELYLPATKANGEVIRLAIVFLHVAAIFQIVDGLQVVTSLSLRGLKDARAPMWIAGGAYWLAGAPMGVWLAFGEHMKGLGIWYGLAFGLAVAAIAMTTRWAWLAKWVK
jgi:MATE family multidrug resistance protein